MNDDKLGVTAAIVWVAHTMGMAWVPEHTAETRHCGYMQPLVKLTFRLI